jgi:hypothetical protein
MRAGVEEVRHVAVDVVAEALAFTQLHEEAAAHALAKEDAEQVQAYRSGWPSGGRTCQRDVRLLLLNIS